MSDPAAAERLVVRALEAFGRLDAAFNNAGEGHMPTPLAGLALGDFDTALRVNVRSIFLMMKYQIPAMLAVGGGAIVNMSSTLKRWPPDLAPARARAGRQAVATRWCLAAAGG